MGLLDLIFGSDEQEDNDNPITIDVTEYSCSPETEEQILVAHENCQILTNGGTFNGLISIFYLLCNH